MEAIGDKQPFGIRTTPEQLLDSVPDSLVITDGDGVVRLVNRRAEALFGYRREELIGRPVEILVPGRAAEGHREHRRRYVRNPTPRPLGAGLDLAARRKDGTEFPADISLSPLETEGGPLVCAAVRDITGRRRSEQERAALETALAEVQREEERAALEVRLHRVQRLESEGRLAGRVAHDFNNLLAAIMNYAGLVSDTIREEMALRGLTDDEAFVMLAQDAEEIKKVAKRAAVVTQQLLAFGRRGVSKPEVLDLNALVAGMEKLLRRTIGEDIDLRTALAPGLPMIRADRGQIEQMLMNLAVNARDAMPAGGRLDIQTAGFEADAAHARLYRIAPGTYVRLTMSDTGSGMSPDVAARALDPLFTTKPKGDGSSLGLGLATVHGIVIQAGGDIVIYSQEGLGTTIRVNLPAESEQPAGAREPVDQQPLSSKGETVLLVEDEEMLREPTRRTLVRRGYTVLTAADADEALRIAGEHRGGIDLLLTDVVMPGRSGQELASAFADLSPSARVLFMSGYTRDMMVHQGVVDEGANLVEKPFAAETLLRKIRDVLDAPS